MPRVELPAPLVGGAQPGIANGGGVELGADDDSAPLTGAGAWTARARATAAPASMTRGARARGVPVTRSAASRPEISAVGTPTPGTVPHPARTAFAVPRGRFPGRNGPVCGRECA